MNCLTAKLTFFTFLVGLSIAQVQANAQGNVQPLPATTAEKAIQVELQQTAKIGADDSLFALQSTIEITKEQKVSPDGLTFRLAVRNPTLRDVDILYFFDLLKVRLRNKQGDSINLPEVSSRLQSGGRNYADGSKGGLEAQKLVTAFKILSVMVNERVLTTQEIQSKTLVLPAGKRLVIDMSVEKVELFVSEPILNGANIKRKIIAIPPDDYSLWLKVHIVKSSNINSQTVFLLNPTQSKNAIVHYTIARDTNEK